ncbi:acyl-CoA synthetase [Prauserella alba]|uniref:Acyl-CoA synthetase n=1 Tax=Prauserella alba TaxID=176898 RepID=A0ABN1VRD1_9PSEU
MFVVAFNIADLLEHAVDVAGDRTAVVCGDRSLTYTELDERANRLAHHLASIGVGKGDHIGVYSRNSLEMIETMFAAYKLRAIAINVNYRYVEAELSYLLDNGDVVALMYERQYSDRVAAVLPSLPRLKHVFVIEDGTDAEAVAGAVRYEDAVAGGSPERDFPQRSGDDLYILYTGGTTGYPKGVMWRHEDVFRALGGGIDFITGEYVPDEWALAEQGRDGAMVRLPAAPLIHGAAQWAAFGALFACGTVVFVPQFEADEVWRAIERHRVNVVTIVGDAMGRPLLDAYRAGSYDASSIVAVSSHAALFSQSVKQEYLAEFPNLVLTDAIGSSESGFTGIGMMGREDDHSAGPRVNFGKDAVLLDDDDTVVAAEPGAVGRIARRGHVPLGYYKDPAKSETIFVEAGGARYVVPGDYARYEEDGTVTLLGRGSQCVNTGGEKVFPEEVEGALKSHPDVFDALVIGVPDERMGQRVGAVVESRPGAQLDLATLEEHVRGAVAGYKVPRSVWLVPRVERLPSGKPDYQWALRHAEAHAPDTEKSAA